MVDVTASECAGVGGVNTSGSGGVSSGEAGSRNRASMSMSSSEGYPGGGGLSITFKAWNLVVAMEEGSIQCPC